MIQHYTPFLVTLFIYFAIIYFIGYLALRLTSNLSDYVLGGRRLSALIIALAAGASDMSGWIMLALPGAAFVNGLQAVWLPIGLSMGAYLNWTFIAKRLRVYTQMLGDALTIPAYLKNRFPVHNVLLPIITSASIVFFFIVYAAAGFISGALLLHAFFNLSFHTGLLITVVGIVVYLLLGGFLALSWIDFFQGALMFFALICVPLITFGHFNGIQHIKQLMAQAPAHHWQLMHHVSGIYIASMLAWGLGYCGQPHILVRFMAIKNPAKMLTARNICMVWMICSLIGSCAIGLLGSLYFHFHLDKPETIMLLLSKALFNPWLVGILMSAVLSAIMSTTSAQILVTASALTEDIYHLIRKNLTQQQLLRASRLSVLLVAAIAYIIASLPHTNLLSVVGYAWSGLGASFGPIIVISLYWSRCTQAAAITGIIIGMVVAIVWNLLGIEFGAFCQ